MIVDGEEQMVGKPGLSSMRAPIDNERNIKERWMFVNIWSGENLDRTFSKIYDCHIEGEDIVIEGSLAGVSRSPYFRYQMHIRVDVNGRIDMSICGKVREDTHWLPRFGMEFELPEKNHAFTYYGQGPWESYIDMCHAAQMGLYESDAEKEYVDYVLPQEHGNRNGAKMLRIGKLEFLAKDTFEINVSKYSAQNLYAAEHTDELKPDGKIHLRIDYKNSGVGSNSCGPALPKKFQLNEKDITFAFSVKPC